MMFDNLKYSPEPYQKIIDIYNLNKKYKIVKWDYTYDKITSKCSEAIEKEILCEKLSDFNRELWDIFAEFADRYTLEIIWGSPISLKSGNPERPLEVFYDGLIFGLIKEQFIECIKNQDVSHFMSCLINFGYYRLKFEVID